MTTALFIRNRLGTVRAAFLLDAAVTGVNAVAYLAAAGPLNSLLGYDAGLLREVGAFLLVFAAAVAVIGTRVPVPRPAAAAVVVANVAWTVASLAVAATGWGGPSTVGTVWTVLQALVVGGLAALQVAALRGSRGRG
jgi:hypothetical protein